MGWDGVAGVYMRQHERAEVGRALLGGCGRRRAACVAARQGACLSACRHALALVPACARQGADAGRQRAALPRLPPATIMGCPGHTPNLTAAPLPPGVVCVCSQEEQHAQVLPALMALMDDFQVGELAGGGTRG